MNDVRSIKTNQRHIHAHISIKHNHLYAPFLNNFPMILGMLFLSLWATLYFFLCQFRCLTTFFRNIRTLFKHSHSIAFGESKKTECKRASSWIKICEIKTCTIHSNFYLFFSSPPLARCLFQIYPLSISLYLFPSRSLCSSLSIFFFTTNITEMPSIPKPHSYHLFLLINKRIEGIFHLSLSFAIFICCGWVLNIWNDIHLSTLIHFDMT